MFVSIITTSTIIIIISTLISFISSSNPFRLSFFTSPISKNTSINSLDFLFSHNLYTRLSLGVPSQNINLLISFKSYNTWVCSYENTNPFYIINNSTSINFLNKTHVFSTSKKNFISGIYVKEIISTEYNINTMIRILVNTEYNCSEIGNGEIGFNKDDLLYSYNNNDSFLEQLFENEIISSKLISIFYNNYTNGEITLGDSDSNLIKKKKFFEVPMVGYSIVCSGNFIQSFTIRSTKKNSYYPFIKESISINKRMMLDFYTSFIKVDKKIFNEIIEVSLNKFISKRICIVKENEDKKYKKIYSYLECYDLIKNYDLDNIEISFSFREKIKLNLKRLFIVLNNKYIFGIIGIDEMNHVHIGEIFLREFYIFFDKEKNSMRFYRKNLKKFESNKNKTFSIILIIIVGIGLLLCLGNVIFVSCKKPIKEKRINNKVQKLLIKKSYSRDDI